MAVTLARAAARRHRGGGRRDHDRVSPWPSARRVPARAGRCRARSPPSAGGLADCVPDGDAKHRTPSAGRCRARSPPSAGGLADCVPDGDAKHRTLSDGRCGARSPPSAGGLADCVPDGDAKHRTLSDAGGPGAPSRGSAPGIHVGVAGRARRPGYRQTFRGRTTGRCTRQTRGQRTQVAPIGVARLAGVRGSAPGRCAAAQPADAPAAHPADARAALPGGAESACSAALGATRAAGNRGSGWRTPPDFRRIVRA